jgi:hypothetical protein
LRLSALDRSNATLCWTSVSMTILVLMIGAPRSGWDPNRSIEVLQPRKSGDPSPPPCGSSHIACGISEGFAGFDRFVMLTARSSLRRRLALAALAAGLAVGAAACGSSSTGTSTASGPAGGTATTTDAVPDSSVVDLATGRTVSLTSALGGDLPTLVWFWAPY